MLRKKGIFLPVARWGRPGAAQKWCRGQSAVDHLFSSWKATESEQTREMFTECSVSVSDLSVLFVTNRMWQDTIFQFL